MPTSITSTTELSHQAIPQPNDVETIMNHLMKKKGRSGNFSTTPVSYSNLEGMKKRFQCSDVYPIVETNLVRYRDRHCTRREDIADVISTPLVSDTLKKEFNGDSHNSELVLLIRITVVSDGSQFFKRISALRGRGLVKLAMCYFLYSRETGEVHLAKQMSGCCKCERDSDGIPELFGLANDLRWKLSREVKFVCCSRLDDWIEHAKSLVSDDDLSITSKDLSATWREDDRRNA